MPSIMPALDPFPYFFYLYLLSESLLFYVPALHQCKFMGVSGFSPGLHLPIKELLITSRHQKEHLLSLDSSKYSLCPSYFSSVCLNTQQPAVIPGLYFYEAPLDAADKALPGTVHTCSFLHAGLLWDKCFQCCLP